MSAGVRPPTLQTGEDRTASRLELFFDLAFVLAVAQAAMHLGDHLTWPGAGAFLGIMTVLWWAWASVTVYANRFDTDDVVFRLHLLAGMLTVVGLAASTSAAAGADSGKFAACYVLLRLLLVSLYARAFWHAPDARASISPYLLGHAASAGLWALSLAVPSPGRHGLWAAGVAVEVVALVRAGRSADAAPLHVEHLPERFGLFVILVLGESIGATVRGLHDGHWTAPVTVATALGFVLAAALWWGYFDRAGGVAKRALLEHGDSPRPGVHDLYVLAHLPIAIGLTALGVGLEHAITESGQAHLAGSTRWVLAVGLLAYLIGVAALQSGMTRRPSGLLWPAAACGAVLVLALGAGGTGPLPILAGLAAVAVALALAETASARRTGLNAAP